MKKIAYIIMTLTTVLASCEQEEFNGTGLEGLREFTLKPIEGSRIELNSIDPNGTVVVAWDEARSGLKSDVNYTWIAYKTGGDVSNPDLILPSDNDGSATQITFTNEQLDLVLTGLGLAVGDEVTLNWTVIATNGDVTKVADPALISIKRFVNAIAPFSLKSPENGFSINLDANNAMGDIVLDWDSTFTGFGDEVLYTWYADVEGGDFSDPFLTIVSDNMGLDHKLTVTNQLLEDALSDLGVGKGQSKTIIWKVTAKGAGFEIDSDEFILTLKRFFVPPTQIFLVGGSTSAGWNPGTSIPFVKMSEGVFEIYAYIEVAGDGFKILENQASFDGDWGAENGKQGAIIQDGEDNFTISEDGFYRLYIDYNDLSYKLDKFQWAIIGSGTPNGWDETNDTNMLFSGGKGDYTWSIDVTLTDGEMKFRANDGWDVNLGDNDFNGSLEYGGSNIPVVAGTYTVSLILDPVNGYSYTLN